MPFVEIRIILVLRLSFAVSKTDEILSLSTGGQQKNTTKHNNKRSAGMVF